MPPWLPLRCHPAARTYRQGRTLACGTVLDIPMDEGDSYRPRENDVFVDERASFAPDPQDGWHERTPDPGCHRDRATPGEVRGVHDSERHRHRYERGLRTRRHL